MRTLIYLEIKKFPLKSHFAGLLAANMIVFLLSVFTSSLLAANGDASALTGLPPVQLDTLTLAVMLMRAVLIVWEAVLISIFIIEEYRNKTISLLFTYPVSRTKLILGKLLLICGAMLLFHGLSNIFQATCIFWAGKYLAFVTFRFGNPLVQAVTAISSVLLGLLPLYIGLIKNSTIAAIVSSVAIAAAAANSQGNSAGLIANPVAAIILGVIGAVFSAMAIHRMVSSDLRS